MSARGVLHLEDAAGTLATLRDAESLMLRGGTNLPRISWLIAEIVAQIKPPKPVEPRGLGAVVEDAAGHLWVLADPENEPSWTLQNESETTWEKYRDIEAVTVLSEGVVR